MCLKIDLSKQERLKSMPKIKLNIKRPSWDSVKRAYMEINMANPNDENLQRAFRQAIIDNGIWRGIPAKKAEQIANEEVDKIINNNYDDAVWQRYALVGGEPLKEYINHKNFFGRSYNYADYSNTCALQVSYAFNYGGMLLENYISKNKSSLLQGFKNVMLKGADNNNYIAGVINIIRFLETKDVWGKADKPYSPKIMLIKKENIDFYNNEFSKFNKNGVVGMIVSGWDDAEGHITLWDREEKKFLDNSNYLLDARSAVVIKEFYFWELK